MDCIAQCLWKHHSNQKITSYSFILFRTCVDIILNMFCPFGLLEAFPWIVFVYFFHRNSWVFFTSSFLFQELSYMMSIFFSNFPFQQLSLCCDFFSDFFFRNFHIWSDFLSEIFLFRNFHIWCEIFSGFFLLRERSHLKWFLFRNFSFQKRSHMKWILLWFSRLRNVIRDRIRYIHGLNYS